MSELTNVAQDRSLSPIFVIVGPSGSGKGTLLESVHRRSDLSFPISATTRSPREGEQDGIKYWFMTTRDFQDLAANNGFVETNYYAGNWYGTLWREIDPPGGKGRTIILELDVHGAAAIKRRYGGRSVVVFVTPDRNPMLALWVIWRRLRGRGTESLGKCLRRQWHAIQEFWWMMTAGMVDHILVNPQGKVEMAQRRLNDVIDAAGHFTTSERKRSQGDRSD